MQIRQLAALAFAVLVWPAESTATQGRLVGARSSTAGVVYENWHFSGGLLQPTRSENATVLIDHVSELSLPITATVPLGSNWIVDASAAYAVGRVMLVGEDPELALNRYTLSGLGDVRLRATGRIATSVALTLGLNIPSGKTSLDPEEYSAFRVLAAPPLSFQVARLGSGVSGIAGLVLSRPMGEHWAGALGVSYELRGSYRPGTLGVLSSPDFAPGDALRVSLGLDGLVGQSGMTLALSADFYPSEDRIEAAALQGPATTQLGPVLTADWQMRLGSRGFRELTVYAVDRYRTSYRIGDIVADGSSGNYFDGGVKGVIAAGRSTGVMVGLNFRHQTGLSSDETIATAGIVSGAATLGIVRDIGRDYVLQPFVRGQLGRLKSGEQSTTATGVAGGVTFGLRF